MNWMLRPGEMSRMPSILVSLGKETLGIAGDTGIEREFKIAADIALEEDPPILIRRCAEKRSERNGISNQRTNPCGRDSPLGLPEHVVGVVRLV